MTIVEQIIAGVAAAHRAGILHGDLKPGNIMLVGDSNRVRAVVTDFGLAQKLSRRLPPELRFRSWELPRTWLRSSSRVAQATFASDVYALGLIVVELLTGQAPLPNATGMATLSAVRKKLSRDWVEVLTRCLHNDPKKRYESVAQFEADVQTLRAFPKSRRRRIATIALITILTAGPVIGFIAVLVNTWHVPYQSLPPVAVLAFRNDSRSQHGDWLSVALPEALSSTLASNPVIRVV